MLFNSLHFAGFFVIVTSLYFLLPHRYRWFLLLASSCYFYMAFVPVYILILGFTIIVDYFAGIVIEKSQGNRRKMLLAVSIIANVSILAIFKYYNFIIDNLSVFLNSVGYENHIPSLSILLPIGLSFHTFQAMSYTIEVYRGNQPAERNFGIYSLYVMFYPQLVAGPIERPQNLLHQFYEKHEFSYENMTVGLKLVLWGLFVKLVVADRLAIYVNTVYNNTSSHSAPTLILATIFFAIQIYCDFSGYSSIAIGVARVMGFKLMTNFNRPYFSTSVQEFWRRWHISLSTWFKDYLYIPLGGNKGNVFVKNRNLFIVFLVSGLWHGASWTFIIWGALHGFYLVTSNGLRFVFGKYSVQKHNRTINMIFEICSTLLTLILVCFAWIFFRANSLKDALLIINNIFSWKPGGLLIGNPSSFAYSIIAILILFSVEFKQEFFKGHLLLMNSNNISIRFATYVSLILMILLFGVFNGGQFIYFQF